MIPRPLVETERVLDVATGGDYSRRVSIATSDELGRVAGSLNQTIDKVRNGLEEIKHAAERERHQARELGKGWKAFRGPSQRFRKVT